MLRGAIVFICAALACATPTFAGPGELADLSARVQAAPSDVDARLRLALGLSAAGRRDEAEAEFRQVIAQAPTYWDAHVGLARIAYWRGDLAEADRRLAPALAAQPSPPDAVALWGRIAEARAIQQAPWRADLAVARSNLSKGLPNWNEATLSLSKRLRGRMDYVAASAQVSQRFKRTDVYVEGLYGRGFANGAEAYVAAGGAPNANFRPELQVRAGVTAPLNGQGLSGGLDGAWATFPTEKTTSLRGTLRQSFMDDRFALSGSVIGLWTNDGRALSGYGVQGESQLAPKLRMTLGYANAPETSEGRALKVRSTSGGLRYSLKEGRSVGLNVLHEDRGAYKRNEVALSTVVRF